MYVSMPECLCIQALHCSMIIEPFDPKILDSQDSKMHVLKVKCLRHIYINLKAKKSLIEDTEALHSQTEFIGLK